MTTFIDIHVLQTVPSSNINRDDTGRPKTAIFGGVQRARVSSQAWKRATRKDFASYLEDSDRAVRTRRIIEDVVQSIQAQDGTVSQEDAIELAKGVLAKAGIKFKPARARKGEEPSRFDLSEYLLFVSNQQVERLARLALDGRGGAIDAKAAKEAITLDHGIEVALFGRMVADDTSLNVDAAVQVAHAVSTHVVEPEYDYYTAVDDKNTESADASAGMIGVVEYNSSTLYRYATVNLDQLRKNLGDPGLAVRAAEAFVQSFLVSMPTGKQNTFANGTLPDAALVQLRDRRPVNLVGAFEEPVRPGEVALSTQSAERLAARAVAIDAAYGMTPTASFVLAADPGVAAALHGAGERMGLPDLVAGVREGAIAALGASA